MTRPTKSLAPVDRLGVYKRLADVPPQYRLARHAPAYANRDVFQEFCEAHEYDQGSGERYEAEVDRVGDHWRAFMADRDRHHAFATPADVEAWSAALIAEKPTLRRAHDYWLRINRFYHWMLWHTEYPHVYNPLLMAAAAGGAAGRIWEEHIARTRHAKNPS